MQSAEGLDFKPFWCPVFWVFLPDVQAFWHGQVPIRALKGLNLGTYRA